MIAHKPLTVVYYNQMAKELQTMADTNLLRDAGARTLSHVRACQHHASRRSNPEAKSVS